MPEPGIIEVRCPALPDGSTPLDEVVAHGVDVHIEQMDDNQWWISIRGKNELLSLWLTTKRAPIRATWVKEKELEA